MNNLGGGQWRPMQPSDQHGGCDFGSAFQSLQQGNRRQITKNPINMVAMSPNGTGGSSGGFNGGFGGGRTSPTTLTSSASAGRLGKLMSPASGNGGVFDFGIQPDQQPSLSPTSFGGMRGGGLMSSGGGGMRMNNGLPDASSRAGTSNGFSSFDRAMSNLDAGGGGGGCFDNHQFAKIGGSMSNGGGGGGGSSFNRQSSMPSNMEGLFNNGYGIGGRNNGYAGMFGRNSSPPPLGDSSMGFGGGNGGSPFKDMQIGTWESSSSSSNGGGGGSGMNSRADSSSNYFEIGTFNVPTAGNGYSSSSNGGDRPQRGIYHNPHPPAASSGGGPGIRETGIIEKLLHSYGFIQCCDRQARLFFHFSQFDGTIEHLKIGDPVEFEMTYDRRTGKPIASLVSKISPEVVMNEERVIGTVTTETRVDPETGQAIPGRISYENRGECFFLPFNPSDVEGNVTVGAGDKCSFQMATMARSGNLVARTIRLEDPVAPVRYQGVVNSVKDVKSYGFIERSDVVREIYFDFGDVRDGFDIELGDDVDFTIQTKNGKEMAADIRALAPGTVIFEDVGTTYFTGQVLKPLDKHLKQSAMVGDGEALNGRIKYRDVDRSEVEVLFGEKDQLGDYTLRHGDWVKFVIAVDRRDKLKRATKIELMDESFNVSDERREKGIVHSVRDSYGFLRCADRDAKLYFNFSECLAVKRVVEVGDECEFTVAQDLNQQSGMQAIRIKHLPAGTVEFDVVVHKDVVGKVDVEPKRPSKRSQSNGRERSASPPLADNNGDGGGAVNSKLWAGKVVYELNALSLEIPLYTTDCRDPKDLPRKDDIIKFDINQSKATKETNAVNIRIIESPSRIKEATMKRDVEVREPKRGPVAHQGYIAALKDGFGFVETLTREKEIFFHFSNVEGKPEKLEVGMEVEYVIFNREKGSKTSAEGVKVLSKGTIPPLKGKEEVLNGKVVRPLRSVNPDQNDYCGLIQVKTEEGKVVAEYEFGIASLLNKKELLQVGDPVQFQIHETEDFAVKIRATREKLRSTVEAMKGQFGFLSYEVDEGKKLFFHTSEVEGGELLQQGDEVEFVVVTNKRNGKHSACCVRKLSSSQRPERLISKLKTLNREDAARGGKKIVVVRQPRGPDGHGFRASRCV